MKTVNKKLKNELLPKGWCKVRLGDILEFKNGLNTEKENYGNGTKFVNVMDIFKYDHLYSSEIIGSVQVSKKQKNEYSVKYGDILFNRTSETLEEIAMSSVYLDKKEILFGGFVIRGRSKINVFTPEYSVYSLQTASVRKNLIKRGQGAVRANIGQKDLSQIIVLLPPMDEQKRIVEVLSTWDQAIAKVEKLILSKEKQFKWLLKTLITDQQNNPNWKKVKLGDIGTISSAGVDKKIIENEKKVKLLNYLDVLRKDFIFSHSLRHWVTASEKKVIKCDIKKGDIFFTPSSEIQGDIAHSTTAMEDMKRAVYSYHVVRFRLKEKWNLIFRGYIFKSDYFYKQAYSRCQGSGQRYVLSQNDFRNMSVYFPSSTVEQSRIAIILHSAQKEIELLKSRKNLYQNQKKGLMQKLLTGKIRLQ